MVIKRSASASSLIKRSASASSLGARPGKVAKVEEINGVSHPNRYRLSGQNTVKSGLCIATHLNGAPCMKKVVHKCVPYCKDCMKKGDPSLKVIQHPKFGKTLICARDLPRNYHIALHGSCSTYKNIPEEDLEWAFVTSKKTYINPRSHDSQLMYSQCPGPNEVVTLGFARVYEMVDKKEPMGSMLFVTKMDVPKNNQLVMMYNDSEKTTEEFFDDRGITRCDVGTPQNPCFLKDTLKRVSADLVQQLGQDVVASRVRKTTSGQHSVKSGLCIATNLNGEPCPKIAHASKVPYCTECMKNGDPSLKVVKHKKFGKQLVAARDLPPKYYMALYGDLKDEKDMEEENKNWGFQTEDNMFIDPKKYDAQIKFCQCPGPNEMVTVALAPEAEYVNKNESMGSMIFVTRREIPKNHQLVMMYCVDEKTTEMFFKERGIERKDVGSKEYPCFTKKKSRS